jgi:hypothetical protein
VFNVILDFIQVRMTEQEFTDMVVRLLERGERAGLSGPITPASFLDAMRTWGRLGEVQEHLQQRFPDRFSLEPPPPIPFQNREDEIREILSSFAPAYYLLDAPAGYGKSVLLEQLAERFGEARWLVAHTRLKETDDLSCLVTALSSQLGANCSSEETDAYLCGASLAGAVRAKLDVKTHNGLILLLDLDKKPALAVLEDLLGQFIPAMQERLRQMEFFSTRHNRFRVIVAGRYLAREIGAIPGCVPLNVLRLTPFDYEVVREAVQAFLPDDRDVAVTGISAHLMHFTGGHPGCLARCLRKYAEVGLTPDAFLQRCAQEVGETIVKPVAQDVRDNVPRGLLRVLDRLCVFRYLDYPLLDSLTEGETPIIKGYASGVKLADTLTGTYLLDWEQRLLRDDITRRLLAIRLREEGRSLPKRCRQAQEICMAQLQRPGTEMYEFWVIEYLYQVLQEKAGAIGDPGKRAALRERFFEEETPKAMQGLTDDRQRKIVQQHLLRALKDDWEFRFTVNYFLREDGYSNLPYQQLEKLLRA